MDAPLSNGRPPSPETGASWHLLAIAFGEGVASAYRHPGQSLGVVASLAVGTAFSLAISATGRSVDSRVTSMLDTGSLSSHVDLDAVFRTLDESHAILTGLSFAYTAALVIAVTVLSLRSLQREVGVKLHHGVQVWEVVTELVVQASLLCLAGGVAGIVLGRALCALLNRYFSELVIQPYIGDALFVFVEGVAVGMGSILLVSLSFALRSSREQRL